jgi:hypothetical protein
LINITVNNSGEAASAGNDEDVFFNAGSTSSGFRVESFAERAHINTFVVEEILSASTVRNQSRVRYTESINNVVKSTDAGKTVTSEGIESIAFRTDVVANSEAIILTRRADSVVETCSGFRKSESSGTLNTLSSCWIIDYARIAWDNGGRSGSSSS